MITKISFARISSKSYTHKQPGIYDGTRSINDAFKESKAIAKFYQDASDLITHVLLVDKWYQQEETDRTRFTEEYMIALFETFFGAKPTIKHYTKKRRVYSYRWLYIHQEDQP